MKRLVVVVLSAALSSACAAILGLDEVVFEPTPTRDGASEAATPPDAAVDGDAGAPDAPSPASFFCDAATADPKVIFCDDFERDGDAGALWDALLTTNGGRVELATDDGVRALRCVVPTGKGNVNATLARKLTVALPFAIDFDMRLDETSNYDGGGLSGFVALDLTLGSTPTLVLLGMNADGVTMNPYLRFDDLARSLLGLGVWYHERIEVRQNGGNSDLTWTITSGESKAIVRTGAAIGTAGLSALSLGIYAGGGDDAGPTIRYRIRYDNVVVRRLD